MLPITLSILTIPEFDNQFESDAKGFTISSKYVSFADVGEVICAMLTESMIEDVAEDNECVSDNVKIRTVTSFQPAEPRYEMPWEVYYVHISPG